ncbi:uncharacterized protein LOC135707205 [Ochlerotatus camptorhynchus]|uniref:uncharacterized protein LOC135707205 n=1 Tax=Ochlerotatus camptorhynchus TaxID=644619 RepID=UPI0031D446CF
MRSSVLLSLLLRLPLLVTAITNGTTTCGRPAINQRRPLIVNGQSSQTAGEWPWHASIWHRVTQTAYVYVCGGTLLSELYVLTAGHCVSKDGNALNERLITVQLGSIRQNLLMSGFPVQNVAVVGNFLHKDFVPRRFNADIALLALRTKVAINEFVRPVCLPDVMTAALSDGKELYGRQAVAIGFGMTEQSETADVLRKIRLPIVDYVTCLTSNREVFGTTLSVGVLCAGDRNGSTVCNGDSGGGLFTEEDDGRWTLRGVTSFTAQRGWNDSSCSLTDYSAFVNVAYYGDWIRYVMENGEQRGFFNSSEGGGEIERGGDRKVKFVNDLRISEKKCKEYRRKGLTAVKPAKLIHTKYFKNDTYTRSVSYIKGEYVVLYINLTEVGLMYFLSDRYALTTVDVARNCSQENVVCETNHDTKVQQAFVHPSYRGGRDFNVAVLLTEPADEFFWCLSATASINLYVDGNRLPLSSIANEASSWVEFELDTFLRTSPATAVYDEHRDVIVGLLQNRAGEPVVVTNTTAMLNWIESVVWNVTYVKEEVMEVAVQEAKPFRQLRSSVAACKDYRRQGLTNVKSAMLSHTDYFKNATHQVANSYTKHNFVQLFRNGTSQGLIYYLTGEFALTSGQVAVNCSHPEEICSTAHDHQVLQVFMHPNFDGERDYSVALLRTTLADEFFWCLSAEPSNQLYYGNKILPRDAIIQVRPTWVEFDLDVYIPTQKGGAVYNDRRDEIEGLLQNPAGEDLVMTNVTALLDWIEPIVWPTPLIEPRSSFGD